MARRTAARLHRTLSGRRRALNRPWLPTPEETADGVRELRLPPTDRPRRSGRDLLVIETAAVAGPHAAGISHYELQLAPDPEADPLVLLTRDAHLYQAACHAEDGAIPVDCTYHISQRPDGSRCFMLDTLTAVERRDFDGR